MKRQHAAPLLFDSSLDRSEVLVPLSLTDGTEGIPEAHLRDLIYRHPAVLPIAEIDPLFACPVAICTELNTRGAGSIDVFLLTPSGLPIIVETKLWRNSEARREVISQIIDYAEASTRWTNATLQASVNTRLGPAARPLFHFIRDAGHDVDERDFNDALTVNLRAGRVLLLIVGDGIRQGVEAIAGFFRDQPALHFTLGLVEMPIFKCGDGRVLAAPRVLSQTYLVRRDVVAAPEGFSVMPPSLDAGSQALDRETAALGDERQLFWKEFLAGFRLDDPEQPIPKPARMGYLSFMMPAPQGSSWLTVYRDRNARQVGVFLSASRNRPGERAMYAIAEDWDRVRGELGGEPHLSERDGRPSIGDWIATGSLDDPEARGKAFEWLRGRTNDFVNIMRPRVRAAIAEAEQEST